MAEKENYEAAQESLRELREHPEQTPVHEEALPRYIGGIAYEEKQRDEQDEREHATRQSPTGARDGSGPH